jgi:hypothetical protein
MRATKTVRAVPHWKALILEARCTLHLVRGEHTLTHVYIYLQITILPDKPLQLIVLS